MLILLELRSVRRVSLASVMPELGFRYIPSSDRPTGMVGVPPEFAYTVGNDIAPQQLGHQ